VFGRRVLDSVSSIQIVVSVIQIAGSNIRIGGSLRLIAESIIQISVSIIQISVSIIQISVSNIQIGVGFIQNRVSLCVIGESIVSVVVRRRVIAGSFILECGSRDFDGHCFVLTRHHSSRCVPPYRITALPPVLARSPHLPSLGQATSG
jgi:hypothetical protein